MKLKFSILILLSMIITVTESRSEWIKNYKDPFYIFTGIKFVNPDVGFLLNSESLFKTTNGGKDWKVVTEVPVQQNIFQDFFVFEDGHGMVLINDGRYRKTSDFGETWKEYNLPIKMYFSGIFAINKDVYWFVSGTKRKLLFTTNDGVTWDSTTIDSFTNVKYLSRTFFIDSLNGFMGTDAGYYLRTTNGGKLWTLNDIGITKSIYFLYFLNKDIGWVGGDKGTFLSTKDGGKTWKTLSFPNDESLVTIIFRNENEGWALSAVGSGLNTYGKIYHTTDGGVNWEHQFTDSTTLFQGIAFSSPNKIWVCGFYGSLLYNDLGSSINENGFRYADISVYPNPSTDYIRTTINLKNVGLIEAKDIDVSLYDALGQKVNNFKFNIETFESDKISLNINTGNLLLGAYYIQLKYMDKTTTVPFIRK